MTSYLLCSYGMTDAASKNFSSLPPQMELSAGSLTLTDDPNERAFEYSESDFGSVTVRRGSNFVVKRSIRV